MLQSVNYHLWEPCNMKCKFCFATFKDVKQSILPKGCLSKEDSINVIRELASLGFEKITFAGGEPTLCPWITDLIKEAKKLGMVTMIVTNGTGLTDEFLRANQQILDWVAISVDSLSYETNLKIGRVASGLKMDEKFYYELIQKVNSLGYGLKINTVVNSMNKHEVMSSFIAKVEPLRWKILQALPILGQNDKLFDSVSVTKDEFNSYVLRNKTASIKVVSENNEEMRASYAMVDPAGRFFDNYEGKHKYSKPINLVGARIAIQEMRYDFQKYKERGGVYDWKIQKPICPKRIVLSGGVASGKSTIGKALAERLGYKFISLGNKVREYAKNEYGLDIVDFQEMCKKNPKIDLELDEKFSKECNSQENIIIDYRLGFHFIKNTCNILLQITEEAAVNRLKKANRIGESYETVRRRNQCFVEQFRTSYGIDNFLSEEHYNKVINVEEYGSVEEIVDFIIKEVSSPSIIRS